MFGYDWYDFVVQLDADHRPNYNYLEQMLRPFICNEKIGYVAAPSICDRNINESWVVRARVDAEATLHGALQAGYNDGWAPMCIGSHYAVRTKALKEIGGLGPELAEDHSTTLFMNAKGWHGAFAFDAIAHGDGAISFYDAIVQEYQWARSLIHIFYEWTPKYLNDLSPKLQFQFLFSQLWYPIWSIAMFFSYLLPIFVIINNEPLVKVDYLDFLIYFSPTVIFCFLIIWWVQKRGWTRPANSQVINWQVILFQLVRWPWIMAGCVDATFAVLRGKRFTFKVTQKEGKEKRPLPLKILFPYFLIIFISIIASAFGYQEKNIIGYYYLLFVNCLIYFGVIISVIILHIKESRIRHKVSPVQIPHLFNEKV